MLPLELFEPEDDEQMQTLMERLARSGLVIYHYLEETVFPATMDKQEIKLQVNHLCLFS